MVVVCHKMVGNICVLHGMRNSEQESMGPCVGLRVLPLVVWFRGLLCSVWHNTSCVGCVGGDSRRVTPGCPFRTRLLSLWALMVLHLGGCGRVGYCQH